MRPLRLQKTIYSVRLKDEEKTYIDSMTDREQRSISSVLVMLIREAIRTRKLKTEMEEPANV